MKITIYCCVCNREHDIELATDFRCRYDGTDIEDGFCPEHAGMADFLDDVCPGCVAGWPECGLRSDMEERSPTPLSEEDFATIAQGRCPRRVNGSFIVNRNAESTIMNAVDLSDVSVHGEAMVRGIREYMAKYRKESPHD